MQLQNVKNFYFSQNRQKNRKLIWSILTRLIVILNKSLFFDWLMSPKMSSQPIPRLTSRQLQCNGSHSVVYPDGKGKVGILENLYKNLLNYVRFLQGMLN